MTRLTIACLALLAACGRSVSPTAPADGSCWVTKTLPVSSGGTISIRAHYAICPSDSTLTALGWARTP